MRTSDRELTANCTAFRYLVMERMDGPITDVSRLLLRSHSQSHSGSVPVGEAAAAMLACLQSVHDAGMVYVDVKPDNFMLAPPASAPGGRSGRGGGPPSAAAAVASRVRLVDFGLAERYGDMSSSRHREDAHPGGPLVGTPAYASLNVLGGHTASRRDDCEALFYVVAELCLLVASDAAGGGTRKTDGLLPWSAAGSDEELKRTKSSEVDESRRSKSRLFKALKAAGADGTLAKYLDEVRSMEYADRPDYDALRRLLKKVVVTVGPSAKSASARGGRSAAQKKAPARKPAAKSPRRSARRKKDESDDDDDGSVELVLDENAENYHSPAESPGKRARTSSSRQERAARRSGRSTTSGVASTREVSTQTGSREISTQTGPSFDEMDDVVRLDDSSDDEEAEGMDWESAKPSAAAASSEPDARPASGGAAGSGGGGGSLRLEVISGPRAGASIGLDSDTVYVGRDTSSRAGKSKRDGAGCDIDDPSMGDVHARLAISGGKVSSVRVTALVGGDGTAVNGGPLEKGKSRQAFVGDKLTLGRTVVQIRRG